MECQGNGLKMPECSQKEPKNNGLNSKSRQIIMACAAKLQEKEAAIEQVNSFFDQFFNPFQK